MMSKFLSVIAVAALLVQPAYTQGRATDSAKQVKSGESVRLAPGVTVKVIKAGKSPFTGVKVKGEAMVVVLELDAGKKQAKLGYKLSTDPARSDVFLSSGEQRLAPRAVIEDFPSWGDDNDKEVEVLDPRDGTVGTTLHFQAKGSVSMLFDVPSEQGKTQKKLSVTIQTVEPTLEQHFFVVSM